MIPVRFASRSGFREGKLWSDAGQDHCDNRRPGGTAGFRTALTPADERGKLAGPLEEPRGRFARRATLRVNCTAMPSSQPIPSVFYRP